MLQKAPGGWPSAPGSAESPGNLIQGIVVNYRGYGSFRRSWVGYLQKVPILGSVLIPGRLLCAGARRVYRSVSEGAGLGVGELPQTEKVCIQISRLLT